MQSKASSIERLVWRSQGEVEEGPDSIGDMARRLGVVRSLQIQIRAREGEEQQDCPRAPTFGYRCWCWPIRCFTMGY